MSRSRNNSAVPESILNKRTQHMCTCGVRPRRSRLLLLVSNSSPLRRRRCNRGQVGREFEYGAGLCGCRAARSPPSAPLGGRSSPSPTAPQPGTPRPTSSTTLSVPGTGPRPELAAGSSLDRRPPPVHPQAEITTMKSNQTRPITDRHIQ